jgi:hypothetical protein
MAIFGDGTSVTKSLGVIHQINIHHGISNTLFIIESNTHLYIYILALLSPWWPWYLYSMHICSYIYLYICVYMHV